MKKMFSETQNKLENILNISALNKNANGWYNARNDFLTASDVASILGFNRYQTREETLLKKAGISTQKKKTFDVAAVNHGIDQEPKAIKAYCKLTGRKYYDIGLIGYRDVHPDNFIVDGIDCSFLAGSSDGITVRRDGTGLNVLEIKSPYRRGWKKNANIPNHYYPQVQINLHILNVDQGDYVEFWPEGWNGIKYQKMRIIRVQRDERWFKSVLPELKKFWDEVLQIKNKKNV
jgi:putative phage-type endonuclease